MGKTVAILKGLTYKLLQQESANTDQRLNLEEKSLFEAIEKAQKKLDRAWANLHCAAPEYTDVAILDIKQAETEYSLLNRKYRMLNKGEVLSEQLDPRGKFSWLNRGTKDI